MGPGDQRARDIARARGEIEDRHRLSVRHPADQPWQVAQHGRDAARDAVDGADIAQIGGQLSSVVPSLIEQLVHVAALRQHSGPDAEPPGRDGRGLG